ncbi:MAG: hypothetical protein R3174_14035, partial [Gammaproteobacteria bacterium]|nr:hypothetical protein [Gammaproteobacteria bacterium]
ERARILHRAADNPLELPFPGPADRDRLLRAYAPVFEVDVAGDDDRIGWPALAPGGLPRVDTSRPVVFAYLSHTRFEGESLLQLNYVIWFPARPPGGPLDILAGRLDGFNWRVTLDRDGGPLIYDSVHNCGCYHLFVPGEKVRFTGAESAFEEPALIPQSLPLAPGRLVVRVASRTHYIQRAYFGAPAGEESYALADYDRLRALDTGRGGRRSLFDANGIVPGTERGERWLFWPMGIENPGAMRQRGRQPTAFVGRRHFDDPDLFSRYFRRVDR